MYDPEALMRLAIEKAQVGIAAGQTPFGCAIARSAELLAVEHNTVWATTDVTAHAEINALRAACQHVHDVHLAGTVAATTCEPCPMCMCALHWARVGVVYYGASIADAKRSGFNELQLPAAEIARQGGSRIQLIGGLLVEECRGLFDAWLARQDRQAY